MTWAKMLDAIFAVPIVAAVGWVVLPSAWFIDPVAVHYDGREVTIIRRVPHGPMYATWSREMHVVGTERDCYAPDVSSYVMPFRGGRDTQSAEITATYREGGWALPCLTAEPPIIAVHTWQVRLFGIIPLRPVRTTATIERRFDG